MKEPTSQAKRQQEKTPRTSKGQKCKVPGSTKRPRIMLKTSKTLRQTLLEKAYRRLSHEHLNSRLGRSANSPLKDLFEFSKIRQNKKAKKYSLHINDNITKSADVGTQTDFEEKKCTSRGTQTSIEASEGNEKGIFNECLKQPAKNLSTVQKPKPKGSTARPKRNRRSQESNALLLPTQPNETKEYCCCPLCDAHFESKDALNIHIKNLHYSCSFCGKIFKTKKQRNRHLKSHDEKSRRANSCKVCCMTFAHFSSFQRHLGSIRHKEAARKLETSSEQILSPELSPVSVDENPQKTFHFYGTELYLEDLACLKVDEWLNSAILLACCQKVMAEANRTQDVVLVDSLTFQYEAPPHTTTPSKIDCIAFIIHDVDHWLLAAARRDSPTILVMDSLQISAVKYAKKFGTKWKTFINIIQGNVWQEKDLDILVVDCAQQRDEVNCGLHVIYNFRYLLRQRLSHGHNHFDSIVIDGIPYAPPDYNTTRKDLYEMFKKEAESSGLEVPDYDFTETDKDEHEDDQPPPSKKRKTSQPSRKKNVPVVS